MSDEYHDSFTESVAKRLDARLAAAGFPGSGLNRKFAASLLDAHVTDACEDPQEAADRIADAMTLDDMFYSNAEFILVGH